MIELDQNTFSKFQHDITDELEKPVLNMKFNIGVSVFLMLSQNLWGPLNRELGFELDNQTRTKLLK